MCSQMRWRLCWENELELADHVELAKFFRATYGPTGAFNAKPFEGSRSWAGARPELRLIGYDVDGIAAHLGLLRRFIKVDGIDLPVAELGLYGIRTDLERLGISHSIRAMLPTLQDLAVPFAFGTVRPELQRHIRRFGRYGPVTVFPHVRVRSTLQEPRLDKPPTRIDDALVVVLPIGRSMSDWPSGSMIDRNGPEL
ncbi:MULTISPECIES: NodA family N-acyltransferase [Rhizobium]|uniref:Nodulation protein A n=3 Tax=Rhizobium TaxID=379 RepID=A0A6P1CGJ8_RHITR|nr:MULTISPECIES: NodA family N-acyltransferase [Rhizobium]AGB73493.1 N-acyltransferase NodA2 [Rhizobium tropici CIAT 899]AYG70420.1 NodA family N-acyltransferase [Rhizobium sp. CCGE531]AYG76957.1 NodA family N-acyltransferase [Rhizobium sp. CCGE532]ENN84751.1 N-acyltransferase NodA2 [Rhizobium freirei PRF 81]MBB4244870.1 nodulation protein A [Rhizobium tropici]